ncbi:SRPBCC domain-containing protein [Patulibacter sp. SYSU D01012]|uniref:SRPBCC domain-containing protein n=1 Tax=Patulibacter sp. SYSU D01012 TaxID=2817381 RepID=UPI001B30263F|nr:SRPBCC domain-containing protein [Patulibacter sp. SYSU D01012]
MTAVTTPPGRTLAEEGGLRLEFVRVFARPVAQVWSALTETSRTVHWIGPWTGDPATGSVELTMTAEEGEPASTVTVHACEAPHRLVVGMASWRLDVTLTPEGDGTRLVLSQPLNDGDDPTTIGPGWHYYLDRLAAEVDFTQPTDAWDDYYPGLKDVYAAP